MSDLKESTISTTVVYKGDFLDVRQDEVLLPNGETAAREWINHPGAVVIVPILPNGEIALIKQFRYAAGSEFICLLYTSPSPRDGLLSRMPSSA